MSSGGSEVLVKVSTEDQMRKKKERRMLSNRDSARRSRMRKQQRLDELAAEVLQLREENAHIVNMLQMVNHNFLLVEAENTVLRTRAVELTTRLDSLNGILNNCMNTNISSTANGFYYGPVVNDGYFSIPWNQPIMADPPFLV